ncbi:hypothetical protein [Flavobacterium tegetincola]|uniref:hypothetical protein n=1 Tax=Flavobacterium tegetincola TaxID=150172 RepID=UPI000408DA1F|nr:hypothetical protein [Flavobacterium tegetincola]
MTANELKKLNISFYTAIVFLLFISCKVDKYQQDTREATITDSLQVSVHNYNNNNKITSIDTINKEIGKLPIYGKLSQANLNDYYPKITDTIKALGHVSAEKLDLNPGEGIVVGMLYNSAVSAQMFLCTHGKKLNLIDKLYVGTATDFNVTSHTIKMKIINSKQINFDKVDWGFIKNSQDEIGVIGHEQWLVTIDKKGLIKNKITVLKEPQLHH